jgi:hypothetical protein
VSLRIAFDMDGTVADMYSVLRRETARLFGPAPQPGEAGSPGPVAGDASTPAAPGPALDALHLTARQQVQLWDHVKQLENFWMTLPEVEPGIIARIASVARERRWDVLFITTRPSSAGDTTQLQTQRWLARHGFELPSVFVVQRSRGRLADALQLDAVVDDRPDNCLDVAADSRARPLLVWPGNLDAVPASLRRMGVRPVQSISDALVLLERLDDAGKRSGLVRSIRRLLRRDPLV